MIIIDNLGIFQPVYERDQESFIKINKNITKNDAINFIKQLRESLMSISDKAALENELKVLLNSLFGDKCSPELRVAIKFSAIL